MVSDEGVTSMEKKTITIQMDVELADRFADFCDDVGLTLDTAFSVFAKMSTRNWALPFELVGDPHYLDYDD